MSESRADFPGEETKRSGSSSSSDSELHLETARNRGLRTTSRDYSHPYRPFPLGTVNAVGRACAALGLERPLSADSVIAAAARKAGMSRGYRGETTDYQEGLEVLVDSIETEARLNPLGRLITRGRLVSSLTSRFRAEILWSRKPEILKSALAPPVVITGLQRTGTTLLHRLMSADPRFRSLSSWEVLNPVPPSSRRGKDPRLKAARRAEKGAAWMSPDFFAVHPIDYRAPEEDVLLLDNSFRSTVAEAILRVPRYAAWLEQADSEPAYQFMRRLLLLLQSVDSRPRWVLKTPHHLEYLGLLLRVFPEARVIQGHRDPSKTTGSFLSMVAHGHGMFTDSPDPEEIGRHWVRKCRRMTECGMAYRRSLSPEEERKRFMDVQFTDLMADPLAVLESIYAFLEVEFDAETRQKASEMLRNHGRYRFGRHVYDLADFGFEEEQVRGLFSDYREEYAIPDER